MTTLLLNGLRILNTRPLHQAKCLNDAILALGGVPISLPGIIIEPLPLSWMQELPPLEEIEHVIFTSSNAVDHFYAEWNNHRTESYWPRHIKVTAIGQGTRQTLEKYDIYVDYLPRVADSEHVLALKPFQCVRDQQIVLVKGEGGRTLIRETLTNRGAVLTSLAVYRRAPPQILPEVLNTLWREDGIDIILFTSEESMCNILNLFKDIHAREWFCQKRCLVLSERLAAAAQTLGVQSVVVNTHENILQGLVHLK